MHKYFNFKQIFEAEEVGAESIDSTEGEVKPVNFKELKGPLTILINKDELSQLKNGLLIKTGSWAKTPENLTDKEDVNVVVKVTDLQPKVNDEDLKNSIVLNLSQQQLDDANLEENINSTIAGLTGVAAGNQSIDDITLEIAKEFAEPTAQKAPSAEPAEETAPESVEGVLPESIEPKRIMSFDQFLNENKI
ncbi:hypothetical protein UFOVP699_228 [uncultured Caudovirales phage]|uniref:Uncharacterized protein n=1 Tax=uncultured Caudovirales phage TaxID=2100421 RepID=A0A6J5NLC3_9CAUD|nr:hypothetical protein UFOVP699_228 [uncultured Caudovirales phage]